jgi:hypothetical protein
MQCAPYSSVAWFSVGSTCLMKDTVERLCVLCLLFAASSCSTKQESLSSHLPIAWWNDSKWISGALALLNPLVHDVVGTEELNRHKWSWKCSEISHLYLSWSKFCCKFDISWVELTNSMEQRPSWEASGHSASQEIPCLYGTRRFITVFTTRHSSLSWARWIQSTPFHAIPLRSVIILSYHLWLGFPSGLILSGFPTKTLYAFLIFLMRATCTSLLTTLIWQPTLIIFGEAYKLWSSSLCSLLHPPSYVRIIFPWVWHCTLP